VGAHRIGRARRRGRRAAQRASRVDAHRARPAAARFRHAAAAPARAAVVRRARIAQLGRVEGARAVAGAGVAYVGGAVSRGPRALVVARACGQASFGAFGLIAIDRSARVGIAAVAVLLASVDAEAAAVGRFDAHRVAWAAGVRPVVTAEADARAGRPFVEALREAHRVRATLLTFDACSADLDVRIDAGARAETAAADFAEPAVGAVRVVFAARQADGREAGACGRVGVAGGALFAARRRIALADADVAPAAETDARGAVRTGHFFVAVVGAIPAEPGLAVRLLAAFRALFIVRAALADVARGRAG